MRLLLHGFGPWPRQTALHGPLRGQAAFHGIIITWSLTSKLQMDRGQAALHGIIITWSLTRKLTDRPGHANHVKKTHVYATQRFIGVGGA